MPSPSSLPSSLPARLQAAVDIALAHGLLKRTDGRVIHCPFALEPCPIDAAMIRALEALTQPFDLLAHEVASDLDFLRAVLDEVVATDEYTRTLLDIASHGPTNQPWRFLVTRNDYFLQTRPSLTSSLASGTASSTDALLIRQVELNTIAASYLSLAGKVSAFHRTLALATGAHGQPIANDPLSIIAQSFFEVVQHYGHAGACVLMIVQPNESNIFDQRFLEMALAEYGIPVIRLGIEDVGERCRLRDGHLTIDGIIAAITYFRAGYRPDELQTHAAIDSRTLIETSSTIAVPDLAAQLAGTKKVQQVLTDPKVLRRFCSEGDAQRLESSFAGIYTLDETVRHDGTDMPAWRAAIAAPNDFVLKPQREGGGFNYYDDGMVRQLEALGPEERRAYILMERIHAITHEVTCVVDERSWHGQVESEIGRFGAILASGKDVIFNRDAGYLVRTKHRGASEGGISAGFGHLDSLLESA